MSERKAAIAIPAFDAANSIAQVVVRARRTGHPVLVIDDGSSDGTAIEASTSGARVISHPENRGKGRALRTAFDDLFARGFDVVVTLDADGQHPPEEVPRLLDALDEGALLVLGTRRHLFSGMSRLRRTSNTISSWLISRVAGTELTDAQTGFRAYTRELVERTGFPEARFEAESAVLVRAGRMALPMAFVPIRLEVVDGTSTSHYRPLIDSFRIAGAVSRARMEQWGWLTPRSS
jgi:glycosyltransferase involved in cell wall biosynthesis